MSSKTWKIAVSWAIQDVIEIPIEEAKTLEEAMNHSLVVDHDLDNSPTMEYIDGSFEINDQVTKILNQ